MSAATTVTVTYTANVSSGNKLISAVTSGLASDPSSVADAVPNSETLLGSVNASDNALVDVSLWAMDVPAGDVGTKPAIKATVASTTDLAMLIQEVSGLLAGNTTAMRDGTAGTSHGGTASYTNPTYSSTATNEYLVSVYGDNGGPTTYAAANSYTLDGGGANDHGINSSTANDIEIANKNSTNGSEAAAYTLSGTAAGWASVLVAFKLASGAAAALPKATILDQAVSRAANW